MEKILLSILSRVKEQGAYSRVSEGSNVLLRSKLVAEAFVKAPSVVKSVESSVVIIGISVVEVKMDMIVGTSWVAVVCSIVVVSISSMCFGMNGY